jgi:hypothetical protein
LLEGPAGEDSVDYLLVKGRAREGAAVDDELERTDAQGQRSPDDLEMSDYRGEAMSRDLPVRMDPGKIVSPIAEGALDGEIELEADGDPIELDGDDSAIEIVEDLEALHLEEEEGLDGPTIEMEMRPPLQDTGEMERDVSQPCVLVSPALAPILRGGQRPARREARARRRTTPRECAAAASINRGKRRPRAPGKARPQGKAGGKRRS